MRKLILLLTIPVILLLNGCGPDIVCEEGFTEKNGKCVTVITAVDDKYDLYNEFTKFRNEIISELDNTEIPDFWNACGNDGTFETLKEHTSKIGNIYGVCAPISKENTHFKYGIGVEFTGNDIPEGYKLWHIKPSTWAVFKCIGETPDCIGATWNKIFSEFIPGSDYNILDDTDFEVYSDELGADCFCEIWVPVEKK